ncbi:MAG: anaerobic ribonucleoside-triphosphate reductase activating protein [Tissierellia bacterium]|nr:anaerobic ribonucleoside-triphosphate reductase activating protein [Tissierellia bacterium]
MKLRVAGIIEESIVDGPGIRLVVFTQGCKHNCIGCHNPETHSFTGGKLIDIDSIVHMVKSNPLLDGITLSGGEPFEQVKECAILAKKVKELGLSVVTYTGYTFEEILKDRNLRELLIYTDILIDGKFDIRKKSLILKFRGSTNQRIIDVKKYLGN